LIDPAGNLVYATSGEVTFEDLNETIKRALPYYRRNKLLDETPLVFDYERMQAEPTPLSHPGKILADEAGGRLFVSDTSHNRVVVCSLEGELLEVIGSGAIGRTDGGYAQAEFDHPQGLALHGETLYVADTENHLLRKVDLREKQVATVAGTGKQRRTPKQWADPGRRSLGNPARQTLNSPWALCIAGDWLYVAMAGAHQVWRMSLDEKRLELHAGSGTEDIVDGALTGRGKVSCFAQPSGLASDGDWLYVADSEGSSLRAVPFSADGKVQTVVGTANLPAEARLFTFGGSDGGPGQARFQHPLDVAWHEGKLYVADAYNNKIRVVDLALATAGTFAGEFEPGKRDAPPHFNEPGGLSIASGKLYVADTNNHAVRVLDLVGPSNGPARSTTLKIVGLDPPNPPILVKPRFGNSKRIKASAARVRSHEGKVVLRVEIDLPLGAKLNEAEPGQYWLEAEGEAGPLDRSAFGRLLPWTGTESTFDIPLPAPGEGSEKLELSVSVLYCGTDNLCRSQNLVWSLPLQVLPDAESNVATLSYRLD
jgi:sugar lactone lactonase YvrE